jgi:hypothetical protein
MRSQLGEHDDDRRTSNDLPPPRIVDNSNTGAISKNPHARASAVRSRATILHVRPGWGIITIYAASGTETETSRKVGYGVSLN